jgi:DNA-directed RNA polymerase subunit beta
LRVFGLETEKDMLAAFAGNEHAQVQIKASLAKDPAKTANASYVEIYKKLRDGEVVSIENAKEFVDSIFNEERYDLSRVGRFHFNKRFDLSIKDKDLDVATLSQDDMVRIVGEIARLNSTPEAKPDDIDHLGMRRVRYVGELLEQKVRKGMTQMKRNIQDKMSTIDSDTVMPIQIVNQRPLQARIKEFFATNQLSQSTRVLSPAR